MSESEHRCKVCNGVMELVAREVGKTTDAPLVWKCLCGQEEALTVSDVRKVEGEP